MRMTMYDCQFSEIFVERNENTPFPMSQGQDLIIAGISRPVSCPDDIVPCSVQRINGSTLARIIHDGSMRNRAVAKRERRAESRGRKAYLKQYVDRQSGEPACLDATPDAARLVAAANPRLQQKRS